MVCGLDHITEHLCRLMGMPRMFDILIQGDTCSCTMNTKPALDFDSSAGLYPCQTVLVIAWTILIPVSVHEQPGDASQLEICDSGVEYP